MFHFRSCSPRFVKTYPPSYQQSYPQSYTQLPCFYYKIRQYAFFRDALLQHFCSKCVVVRTCYNFNALFSGSLSIQQSSLIL